MKRAVAQPVSIRLDPGLKRRAEAFARRRKVGLTTGLRMIISERLDALDASEDLDQALRWQRDRAWATLESWESGDQEELTLDDIVQVHRKALRR
jgi:hypothetical protein